MISDEILEKEFFDSGSGYLDPALPAFKAGARFSSRLERIRTLVEVRNVLSLTSEARHELDRLIEQAKSE